MALYSSTILYIALFFGLYYQIFLLVTFFEKEEENNLSEKKKYEPTVTIIVPCFNESKTVAKTVLSLLKLNYPKEKLFITVVDDGSSDSTYEEALKIASLGNIRVLRQKNSGKYVALNKGIEMSESEIVGCLDADSTVAPGTLQKMLPYFLQDKVVAVTPAMKVHNPKTLLQRIQNAEYNIGILLKKIMGKLDAIHVTPGPFSLFKKSVFKEIGYFRHAHNTEDMEIAFRIQHHHYRIANCPQGFVYTITPPTFKKLYKQRVRWTYGFLKNAIDYRHMFFNKKYGNIGTLTLPFAIISIITAFLVISNSLYHFSSYVVETIQRYTITGITFNWFSFDPFFFNTSSITLLTFTMLCSSFTIILLAWSMVEGKARITRDIVYFVALYGFIAPLWLAKASWNTITSKAVSWR
ncbi:MAG: hypothetical protein QG640_515 [Patescibacteria group bacterium]|nr:hypothetical protein [Patescibacteria group bacterium]